MKPNFESGDVVLITCTGEVVTLTHYWQGLIDGFWNTNKGFYLIEYSFEHACDALKILHGDKNYENVKGK